MNAVQLAARQRQVTRRLGAAGQHDCVETVEQFLRRHVDADMHTRPEGDTLARHLFHAAVDLPLLELEIRDAVAHQPADAVLTVEQGDVMAGAGELLRAGHARRPRSDDSDALRSEEHTSELQSLMRISYAAFCLQKKKNNH